MRPLRAREHHAGRVDKPPRGGRPTRGEFDAVEAEELEPDDEVAPQTEVQDLQRDRISLSPHPSRSRTLLHPQRVAFVHAIARQGSIAIQRGPWLLLSVRGLALLSLLCICEWMQPAALAGGISTGKRQHFCAQFRAPSSVASPLLMFGLVGSWRAEPESVAVPGVPMTPLVMSPAMQRLRLRLRHHAGSSCSGSNF